MKIASTTTLPVIRAVIPVTKESRTILEPITFPRDNCGEFAATELIPTKSSGIEVAMPSMTNETIKVLKRKVLAIFTRFVMTRSADFAKMYKLAASMKKLTQTGIG